MMISRGVTLLVPVACVWARWHEAIILKTGVPLPAAQVDTARKLGIVHPELVRLRAIGRIPPAAWPLRWIGEKLGFSSAHTIGMTLRYGIYIHEQHWGDRRLLIHELAHVAQYERMGGFYNFLAQYLPECLNPGYPLGELELEAKRVESMYS